MVHVVRPPNPLNNLNRPLIFLAGSIEMGRAEDWQTAFAAALQEYDVTLMNPRRDAWDASWEQSIDNPPFREQVQWELDGLEMADLIVVYFAPETKAPITLLELGLFARTGRLLVCCPDGFWRKGNIEIVCDRFDIPLLESFAALVAATEAWLREGTGR